MIRVRPRKRYYFGGIEFQQPKIDNWIRRHRSFASRDWFRSEIRYGLWKRERNRPYHYRICPTVFEGTKRIRVVIKTIYYRTEVQNMHMIMFMFIMLTCCLKRRLSLSQSVKLL